MHTNPPKPTDCGNSKQYIYLHQYGENSIIIGRLNYDTIGFGSTGMEQSGVTFPKSIFGCVFYSNFRFKISTKAYGIVDLGSGPLSLASQLGGRIGHKFSYCMVPFSSTSTGKLKFGSMAPTNGVVSTPLMINPSYPSYYVLNLEGITIGQKKVGPSKGISIFGNWTQVNFRVEYDLGEKKVSFAPINCSTI
ncbi:Aspartic proteinase nepenthesin-1 [Glycine soja]|nr:Aspartic proteinase nepenthesin-1 [Glycine soja]